VKKPPAGKRKLIPTSACGTFRYLGPRGLLSPSERVPLLNSHRIREVFGSYVVDVLQQTEDMRIASLCSLHNGTTVCRTLAVTCFLTPTPLPLRAADAAIRQGESIGETLSVHGFSTQKSDDFWCRLTAGPVFSQLTQADIRAGTDLAVRLYTLRAQAASETLDYAVIAEAYHPDHIPCEPAMAGHPVGLGPLYQRAFSTLQTALALPSLNPRERAQPG
jgi:hypothetical protein